MAVDQSSKGIRYSDLKPSDNLIELFNELDDILVKADHSRDESRSILHKLLLVKVWDEQTAKPHNGIVRLTDISQHNTERVERLFRHCLRSAVQRFPGFPIREGESMGCSAGVLRKLTGKIHRVSLLASKRDEAQRFAVVFGQMFHGESFNVRKAMDVSDVLDTLILLICTGSA